jgi:hypothetical protein
LKGASQSHGNLLVSNQGVDARLQSTPLRSIGEGTSTGLGADVLTDTSASFPLPDDSVGALGLVGLELNPNLSQSSTFTVIGNNATQIFIDTADGQMTDVASAGATYVGVYFFDELTVTDGAQVYTGDRIETPTYSVDASSSLESQNINEPEP